MASTNQTTHYELSQYIGTDKPTYLVDYNQDMSKIDTAIYGAKSEADVNSSNIGDLSTLSTTVKNNLVNAINEVEGETSSIGTLSSLTTTVKTDLVSAINEVNSYASSVGDLNNLTTTAKSSAVVAINEVDGDIGDLSSLTTTSKSSTVSAINELDGEIGTLSSLTTTDKTDLVSAINEIDNLILELDNYSTTESDTGKHWIDGKRIYRKVFEFNRDNHSSFNIQTNLSIDSVISISGCIKAGTNIHVLYTENDTDQFRCYLSNNGGQININVGSSYPSTPFTGFIVLEYTKTV